MRRIVLISGCLWFTIQASIVLAEEPAGPCEASEYHQFDFWIGQWEVYTATGQLAGRNTITAEEGHCLLVEHWQGQRGSTGQSYNYYNPATGKWQQLWISNGTIISYSGGLSDDGAMLLEGTISYHLGHHDVPFRGQWTLRTDGTVLQEFVQYDAQSDTWTNWFTGIYHRKD